MRGFNMPAYWEIMPDQFIPGPAIKQAERMSHMPKQDRVRAKTWSTKNVHYILAINIALFAKNEF